MTTDEKLDLILSRLDNVDARLDNVDARLDKLENKVSSLEAAQLQTTAQLEGTIDRCVQVLYESHTLNSERLDKYDIEAIKRNADIAVTMAKMAYDTVMKKAV